MSGYIVHQYPALVESLGGDKYRVRYCGDRCDLSHGVGACCIDTAVSSFDDLERLLMAHSLPTVADSVREWRATV